MILIPVKLKLVLSRWKLKWCQDNLSKKLPVLTTMISISMMKRVIDVLILTKHHLTGLLRMPVQKLWRDTTSMVKRWLWLMMKVHSTLVLFGFGNILPTRMIVLRQRLKLPLQWWEHQLIMVSKLLLDSIIVRFSLLSELLSGSTLIPFMTEMESRVLQSLSLAQLSLCESGYDWTRLNICSIFQSIYLI